MKFNAKYLDGLKEPTKAKIYKTFESEVKVADDVKRTLIVKISTPTADRSHDTVQPNGMQYDNFIKNPVVLFAHDYKSKPIAKCTSLKISESGVMATVEFPPEGMYKEADIIYAMYKDGFLNAWSIGFMPIDYDVNAEGGYNFKSWEMFEFSSVPVPDNPEALTVMRSKGIEADLVVGKGNFVEEVVAPTEAKDADNPSDPGYSDTTKITELTVTQLKNLIDEVLDAEELERAQEVIEDQNDEKGSKAPVIKDTQQVIQLSYVIDCLNYFINYMKQDGVNEEDINKLNQALSLVLDVVKSQAEIGKKSFTIKSGRTISSKHEDMLKNACEHMKNASEQVQVVLNTVAEEEDTGKEAPQSMTSRLFRQVNQAQKQMKETDKQIGLTLRLFKTIQSESKKEGGE